ncbi:hypothetical protein [Streptomyces sp. C3-3]|uniref:hypothetical protein n=1 Tax=Streptomyces sp. C3-3 TaxID=2824901 RepID=UPI001FFD7B0F|nr:hypothetical protein [Streptomyces sp. C3-3]
MTDNQRPPNRRLVEAVYPFGTHLDFSRASSDGMRGNVRDDRDNSLIGQAELFDAPDRYADGYHDGYDHRSHDDEFRRYLAEIIVREVTSFVVDVAWEAAARGITVARPRVSAWARHAWTSWLRTPKAAAAAPHKFVQEFGPKRAPSQSADATANGHQRVDPVLRAGHGDACANAAMERIIARAVEVHGLATRYAADLSAADAADTAMRQAVAAASPGLAAATLQLISSDAALGLTPEQQKYMWERAAELDLAVVEDLTSTNTTPAHGVERQQGSR